MTPPARDPATTAPSAGPSASTPAAAYSSPALHRIAAISVTHHRLNYDPPFHASWDTKPRVFFDATDHHQEIVLSFQRKHGIDEVMPRALLAELNL